MTTRVADSNEMNNDIDNLDNTDVVLMVGEENEHLADKECLFCLDHIYEELLSDEENDTNLQEKKRTNNVQTLQNFNTLFPCNCSVYAHSQCLQTWLLQQQTCPICIVGLTVENISPHAVFDTINDIRLYTPNVALVQSIEENTQSCEKCSSSCVFKRLIYASISCILVYLCVR